MSNNNIKVSEHIISNINDQSDSDEKNITNTSHSLDDSPNFVDQNQPNINL
jgi:hypothetical protein